MHWHGWHHEVKHWVSEWSGVHLSTGEAALAMLVHVTHHTFPEVDVPNELIGSHATIVTQQIMGYIHSIRYQALWQYNHLVWLPLYLGDMC